MRLLSAAQHESWEASGRLIFRQALDSARLTDIDRAAREVEAWSAQDGPGLHHFELANGSPKIARSEDFEPHHPILRDLLRHGLISEILGELFGEPPTLFKEKINYKHPGGGGFAPHQDATAYRFVDHHISVMVPLDAATQASGCLWFCDREPSIVPNVDGRISSDWVASKTWTPIEVEAGDLVVFDSYAPHYSETNATQHSRRALYVTYNRQSDGDFRERYYRDKRAVLASADTGSHRLRISLNDDFLGRPVN